MKEVVFIKVKSALCGYGFGKGARYSFAGAEETIREQLQNGWEYCGFVPVETRGQGDLETISLIFQREAQETKERDV